MLDIMKEKERQAIKLFNEAEKKLAKILCDEFKDFDSVTVKSYADHDELELQRDGKAVKLRLTTKRYDGKINNNFTNEDSQNNGLYFRKSGKSVQDFNKKEFKEIQSRLQALYEK